MNYGKFTLSYVKVDEGYICIRKVRSCGQKSLFEVYTFCPEFGDFESQFGFMADTREEALDVALANYRNGDLFWSFELECDDVCEACDRRYKCHESEYRMLLQKYRVRRKHEQEGEPDDENF